MPSFLYLLFDSGVGKIHYYILFFDFYVVQFQKNLRIRKVIAKLKRHLSGYLLLSVMISYGRNALLRSKYPLDRNSLAAASYSYGRNSDLSHFRVTVTAVRQKGLSVVYCTPVLQKVCDPRPSSATCWRGNQDRQADEGCLRLVLAVLAVLLQKYSFRSRFSIQCSPLTSSSDIWSFRVLGQFLPGPERNVISYNKISRIYGLDPGYMVNFRGHWGRFTRLRRTVSRL